MAARIRLARHGSKKHPFYRIVVTDSRTQRDGRRLDQIGTYDPTQNPSRVHFEEEKLDRWLQRGAQPTLTVAQLIKRRGLVPAPPAAEPQAGPVADGPARVPTPESGEA